jgi:hypothetical protein
LGRVDEGFAALYAEDAVNNQGVMALLHGRAAMVCIIEKPPDSGDWACLDWSDPNDLRGSGLFQVCGGPIVFRRGYVGQSSFFRLQGLPVPGSYRG